MLNKLRNLQAIIPKGWFTKIFAVILLIVTSPALFEAVQFTGESFYAASEITTITLAQAYGQLVASFGIIFGILRRTYLK